MYFKGQMHPSSNVVQKKFPEKYDGFETWHVYGRDTPRDLVGKPDRKKPLGSPGIDRRIILKQIFKK
jgi:hypothetical protein